MALHAHVACRVGKTCPRPRTGIACTPPPHAPGVPRFCPRGPTLLRHVGKIARTTWICRSALAGDFAHPTAAYLIAFAMSYCSSADVDTPEPGQYDSAAPRAAGTSRSHPRCREH